MHHIAFKVVPPEGWFGEAIEIKIDGTNLIELVREFETPMAVAEGSPNIAGGYMGIAAATHLPPSKHFLGIHDAARLQDAKTDIFWCGDCGEPGCWPLLARITINHNRIIWSQFEQPHRAGDDKAVRWAYDDFGPFIFDRSQYALALNSAAGTHT